MAVSAPAPTSGGRGLSRRACMRPVMPRLWCHDCGLVHSSRWRSPRAPSELGKSRHHGGSRPGRSRSCHPKSARCRDRRSPLRSARACSINTAARAICWELFSIANTRVTMRKSSSPAGVAQVNRVLGHAKQTLATASYAGLPQTWFDVKFELISLNVISVSVDGKRVFDKVHTADKFAGRFGLMKHWTPGKFDDVCRATSGSGRRRPQRSQYDGPGEREGDLRRRHPG